ncbi:DNA-3-methyladenine glycosylase I [Rothia nasimurium]|uniref:DNA-3-methyladenine glycosylase I n=1 Tax=Rothia nasimurium TaxID=85336 RepID=UPI001F28ECA2|nr:DNA-3-methyladenine glycosylase I [Rothia nasimurium]
MTDNFITGEPKWVRDDRTRAYFEHEWQTVPRTTEALFEHLCLLVFQSGLWWSVVLAKRNELLQALHGFQPHKLAAMDEEDIAAYLGGNRGIRNESKLRACINNAKVLTESQVDLVSLFDSAFPTNVHYDDTEALPRTTAVTDALAQKLRSMGFQRLGPVVLCAAAQAAGYIRLGTHPLNQRDQNRPVPLD